MAFSNKMTDARAVRTANALMSMLATKLHANAVSLNFPLWQHGSASDDPERAPMTPSPERLIAVTEIARRYGLSVQWRPYLFEGNLMFQTHNSIVPTDPTLWMTNYWRFLRPYLVAANLAGVSSFSIGVELRSMLQYLSQWATIVRQAKALYSGTIVYSQQHAPQASIPLTARGYDAYQPIPLPSTKDATAAAFTKGFEHNLRTAEMQSALRDLTLEEVGITATRRAYFTPSAGGFSKGTPLDRGVQTAWFQGACNAFWQLHLAGIYFYTISFLRYRPGENDATSYGAWLGTSTATAVASCFSRTGPPAPAPPASGSLGERRAGVAPSTTWDPTTPIEPMGGHPSSISCPTPSFCAEVDLAGAVRTEVDGTWSAPTIVDPSPLVSLACSAATTCVAVDDAGGAVTYDGSTWTGPVAIDSVPLTAVSCAPGTTRCVAVDVAGDVVLDRGGAWAAPTAVASSPLTAISCAAANRCVAVDAVGVVHEYTGYLWPVIGRLGLATLTAVECTTATTCLVGSDDGTLYGLANGSWVRRHHAVPSGVVSIACATATHCDALGPGGVVGVSGGLTLTPQHGLFAGDEAVSVACPPGGACTAISYGGSTATDGSSWVLARGVDPRPGELTADSCGSATFCVAVDDAGAATRWNGSSWSSPAPTHLTSASAVSCVGTLCVAVSDTGAAVVYSHGRWGRARTVDRRGALTAVSCVSATFCAAVDASDHVLRYNGATWTRPRVEVPRLDARGYQAISCAAPTFCVAVDTHGDALTVGKGRASLIQADTHFVPLTAIACPTTTWCVAVDDRGRAITRTVSGGSSSWSAPHLIDGFRLTAVSCTATGICLATDDHGGTVAYAHGTWAPSSQAVPLEGTITAVSCASSGACAATDSSDAAVATVR